MQARKAPTPGTTTRSAVRTTSGPAEVTMSAGPAAADRRTWLEIGFGGGEHLLAQARAHPDVAMVGCEPFLNGMAKLLAAIDREALTNVRVYDDDVTRLLPAWPAASIDRVSILYPDPWPKRRQRKRRLAQDQVVAPADVKTIKKLLGK
jgi:tRNA (guanine-N7-)-methyltransferase